MARADDSLALDGEGEVVDWLVHMRRLSRDDFRILDAADELSFLQMECDLLGAARIGQLAFDSYQALTGDRPPVRLRHFYRSLRACVRALLAANHLDDENVDVAKWTDRANAYLELAESYLPGMRAST